MKNRLLHIWSEQYNLTPRVIAITDHFDPRLVLAVERFGRSRPDRLEFVRIDFERSACELSREEFCERFEGTPGQSIFQMKASSLRRFPQILSIRWFIWLLRRYVSIR